MPAGHYMFTFHRTSYRKMKSISFGKEKERRQQTILL